MSFATHVHNFFSLFYILSLLPHYASTLPRLKLVTILTLVSIDESICLRGILNERRKSISDIQFNELALTSSHLCYPSLTRAHGMAPRIFRPNPI